MAVKVGTLLGEILGKAGVDTTKPEFASALAVSVELPDEVATEVNTKLLTVEAAKHNPTLKGHFQAITLSTIDQQLENLYTELGFDDATKEALGKEKTFARVGMAAKKAKELAEATAATKYGDKETLIKENKDLHKKLADETDGRKQFEKNLKEQHEATLLETAVDSFFATKQYASDVPQNVNILTAKNLLMEDLKAKKGKIVRNADNTLKLVQSENPDSDLHDENHKPFRFTDYADKLLSTNKLLKTHDPKKQQTGNPNPTPGVTTGNGNADHSKVVSAIDEQIAQLAAANGTGS